MEIMPQTGIPLLQQFREFVENTPLDSRAGLQLLSALQYCGKRIATELRRAGGNTRALLTAVGENVSGDLQKPLDLYSHELLVQTLISSGAVRAVGSEESPELIEGGNGEFVVIFDPLDGSSNIESQVPTGTIFSIYSEKAFSRGKLPTGYDQIAAGYILYSSATVLVFSAGSGVFSFLLDADLGEFCFFEKMELPEQGETYSINEANAPRWQPPAVRTFVERLKGKDNPAGKAYTLRYVGTLVADAHRTLKKGGVFIYPGDTKNPQGKLRLLYEAYPMAYLFEKAGGRATNGVSPILAETASEFHARTPLFLGSSKELELYSNLCS